jgi:hypothetical protein
MLYAGAERGGAQGTEPMGIHLGPKVEGAGPAGDVQGPGPKGGELAQGGGPCSPSDPLGYCACIVPGPGHLAWGTVQAQYPGLV